MSEKTLFEKLYAVNVNEKVEKKANLSYLSWAWAWAEVKKIDPQATSIIHEFPLPGVEGVTVPYLQTPTGYFVKVSVTIQGHTETEWLPVMDHRNKTMEKPTAFDINKNTKRCLVKAIALHGLGLYIYAGEDLPEGDSGADESNSKSNLNNEPVEDPANSKQIGLIKVIVKSIGMVKKVPELEVLQKALKEEKEVTYDILTTLTKSQASELIKLLQKWQEQSKEVVAQ